MPDSLIGFGSNQGDSGAIHELVLALLARLPQTNLVNASRLFETKPIGGPGGQRLYSNGVIRLATELLPGNLHEGLIQIETQLGRVRKARWGSRVVDLDLLLYGSQKLQTDSLTVPHPRMSFRRFVLEPALLVAGDMLHVDSGKTIEQLIDHLNSTPQTILILSNSARVRKRIVSIARDYPDWGFTFAAETTADLEPKAKLVVDIRSCDRELNRSSSMPNREKPGGPCLCLQSCEVGELEIEIRAAIEGML